VIRDQGKIEQMLLSMINMCPLHEGDMSENKVLYNELFVNFLIGNKDIFQVSGL